MADPERGTDPRPEGAPFQPFVSPEVSPPELTVLPIILGTLLGIIFAFSSVYLSLKVGLTVSASIPVAVMSITLFRWLARSLRIRPATILENNIAQTAGSAGESLAAGVAFTLPSLLLMGFEMEFLRILLVALFGGLIGVLMMVPLRHSLIVKEHGKLTYPEGTACADVLIVGEQGGTNAKTVFLGFFVGLAYASLNLIARLWNDTATFAAEFWGTLKGARVAFDVSPPMLGVGYIIGPRVAANMMAGGLLAFVVLVPLVHLFGDSMPAPMYPETQLKIAEMTAYQIRSAYVLYVGAGAVATGGFIALARALPSIV
ncbi:MAG TPA: OPT/YSL family transporter, partial [Myxococcaceae bacterium]|nr:OPT/YSL family transporter [Myxococcaceae bacterium]